MLSKYLCMIKHLKNKAIANVHNRDEKSEQSWNEYEEILGKSRSQTMNKGTRDAWGPMFGLQHHT